ncbi:MAG: chalcone isomerase family protein, partial [Bdellovibrio sp.]
MKALTLVLATLLLSTNAPAALLTNEASNNKLEKVSLSSSATYNLENEILKLSEVGAGLRAKKVVFVNIKVYVGELFVSDLAKFNKENPIASLKDQKAVAIQLHFLRSVDSENVQKSFKEALKANDVNLDE